MIVAALFVATASLAQPYEGTGRIAVHAGWRYTPNTFFADSAERAGFDLTPSPGGPQLTASFAYAATQNLEVAIDLFAGGEELTFLNAKKLTSATYGGLLGFRAVFPLGDLIPSIGAAVGPTLVYTTGGPADVTAERFVTAYAAIGGLSYRFSDQLAVSLDVRYLLARGFVQEIGGVNAGGLWGGLGVTYFFAPEVSRSGAVR